MDGLDRKMIFKFGKHLERLHSTRKQCLRIYKDHFALQNTCWEVPNPLNLHPLDAGYAIESLNKKQTRVMLVQKYEDSREIQDKNENSREIDENKK